MIVAVKHRKISFGFDGEALTMNQTTKKQHYIWRNYLAAWTKDNSNTGQIMCLRDNHVFPVSLMKIAHENYFYGVKELSELERSIIFEMTIKNKDGTQRAISEGWLNLYCAPFDYVDKMTALGCSVLGHTERIEIEENQTFKDWNIEYIEKLHGIIESTGMPYISMLRQNDLSFWNDEADRDKFGFFISNQYFRTKKIRDSITTAFKICETTTNFSLDVHPENMWLPLSLIFASNVGVHIAHSFSAVLFQSDDACFIVGDQPVINTHSTFDALTQPNDLELFYPITPYSALLLTTDRKYVSGQTLKVTADEVAKYNVLEQRVAREMLFAKERSHLDAFITSG